MLTLDDVVTRVVNIFRANSYVSEILNDLFMLKKERVRGFDVKVRRQNKVKNFWR